MEQVETNEKLKVEFNSTASKYKVRLTKVEAVLEDRVVNNTMAGAREKIEEFYKYKTDNKNVLLGDQLHLEGLYNNLAMR